MGDPMKRGGAMVCHVNRLAVISLAGILAFALMAALAFLAPGGALASGITISYTSCSQASSNFSSDLTNVTSGNVTFDFPASCTIDLANDLFINSGVDITINGNGLVLDAGNQDFDDIEINRTPAASGSLVTLNQMTIENGRDGINDVIGDGATPTVVLTNSTISGNTYDGIVVTTTSLINSTISGNGYYGVLANDLTVVDSTFSDQGLESIFAGSVTMTASILAGTGSDCSIISLTDGGYNLAASPNASDSSCKFTQSTSHDVPLTGTGGLNLVDSGVIGNYGGLTETVALGTGSVAIDAIPVYDGQCTLTAGQSDPILDPTASPPSAITADQRGIARPEGAGCDSGAYEAPAVAVSTTDESGSPVSADSATGWFNAATLGGQGKKLDVSVSYTGLATGELPNCGGATFTGLPTTTTGLNQTAGGAASLGDGQYTVNCGVKQGATALGVSQQPSQPVTLNVDTIPPSAPCEPPDTSIWYDHNVTVSCAASDTGSGLTNSALANFSLSTTVAVGSADKTASTGSQHICDAAGNCVTDGPYSFMVDLAPPTISTPVANARYILDKSVALGCSDVGSGIHSCQVTVTLPDGSTQKVDGLNGQDVPTNEVGTYTVSPDATVTDVAGNADTTSFTYTVSYQIASLPGSTPTVQHGYWTLVRIFPEDLNGHDYASRTLKATTIELDGPGSQVIPFAYAFQFGHFGRQAGYQIEINTRNLSLGPWTLKFEFAGDPTMYQVTFRVVE